MNQQLKENIIAIMIYEGYKETVEDGLMCMWTGQVYVYQLWNKMLYNKDCREIHRIWDLFKKEKISDSLSEFWILTDHKNKIAHAVAHGTKEEAFEQLADAITWYNLFI